MRVSSNERNPLSNLSDIIERWRLSPFQGKRVANEGNLYEKPV